MTLLGSEAILDIESELTDDGTRILNYIPNAGGRRHFFLVRYPAGARGPVEGWVESHNLAGL